MLKRGTNVHAYKPGVCKFVVRYPYSNWTANPFFVKINLKRLTGFRNQAVSGLEGGRLKSYQKQTLKFQNVTSFYDIFSETNNNSR